MLWPESSRWEALLATFAHLVEQAGYGLAHTPLFEDVRVFRRGIGEGSDVVGKEMYEFEDRGGRTLALRPEGTAPIVRAYVQHRPPLPWKAWYATPAFRYERPQAGRYRQHHQLGVEALGPEDPDLDVEVIGLAHGAVQLPRLDRLHAEAELDGRRRVPPGVHRAVALVPGRAPRRAVPLSHQERLEANPCGSSTASGTMPCRPPPRPPRLVDHLCGPCREHFDRVQAGLRSLGIPYELDHRLVRVSTHYTRTTFEFASQALDAAQNGIGGGGRYDGLVEMLGGPPTPGIGFGIGIERVLLACDAEHVFPVAPPVLDAYVVDVAGGETARDLTAQLRRAGLRADRAFDGRSMRSQLKLRPT